MSTQRIAVVGSGIAGLTAAYLLSSRHQVTMFEANDYLGGHAHTVPVELEGECLQVDTGFIVCNNRNYPRFLELMRQLGVKLRPTEMSFSVRNDASGLEYNGHNLNTLFAQRRNLLRPGFYRLIADILRFNRAARAALRSAIGVRQTLLEFVANERLGQGFRDNYLLPMVAAIWSCSVAQAGQFPLAGLLRFFHHHGLLDIRNRPRWYTVQDGSQAYVQAIIKPFAQRIHLRSEVSAVRRSEASVALEIQGRTEVFDHVILACHSDQALRLLQDPSRREQQILAAIAYRQNDVILHTDRSLMPSRALAWASWNFVAGAAAHHEPPLVTYCMNILQGLPTATPLLVSLNARHRIDPASILREFRYAHPIYCVASCAARERREEICGVHRLHYCGAYWYDGFHEDAVRSAIDVAQRFGVALRSTVSCQA